MNGRNAIAVIFVAIMVLLAVSILGQWQGHRLALENPPSAPRPVLPVMQPATPEEERIATTLIGGQLAAFRKLDFAKATSYQTIALRERNGTAAAFGHNILYYFPEFCSFASYTVGKFDADPGGHIMSGPITLTARNGKETAATYFLVRENGVFRINRVDAKPLPFHFTLRHTNAKPPPNGLGQ